MKYGIARACGFKSRLSRHSYFQCSTYNNYKKSNELVVSDLTQLFCWAVCYGIDDLSAALFVLSLTHLPGPAVPICSDSIDCCHMDNNTFTSCTILITRTFRTLLRTFTKNVGCENLCDAKKNVSHSL